MWCRILRLYPSFQHKRGGQHESTPGRRRVKRFVPGLRPEAKPGWLLAGLMLLLALSPAAGQVRKPEVSQGIVEWLAELGKQQMVLRVIISPDGQWGASATSPQEKQGEPAIQVWNLATGKLHARLSGSNVYRFSPDSKSLLCSGGQGKGFVFHLWEVASQRILVSFFNPMPMNIRQAIFAKDGRSVYLIGGQPEDAWMREQFNNQVPLEQIIQDVKWTGYVSQWSLPDGKLLRKLVLPKFNLIYDAAFTSDEKELAIGGRQISEKSVPNGQRLELIDVAAWKPRLTLIEGDFGIVKRLAYVEEDRQLLVLGDGVELAFYRTDAAGPPVRRIALKPHGPAFDMALAPNQSFIITAQNREIKGLIGDLGRRKDSELVLWNYQSGQREHQVRELKLAVLSVAVSPDGNSVLFGTFDGRVGLWRWK